MIQADWVNKINAFGKRQEPCFFVINFEANHGEVFRMDALRPQSVGFQFPYYQTENLTEKAIESIQFHKRIVLFKTYQDRFNQVLHHLKRGDTYLLNLTLPTPIDVNLNLSEIYAAVQAKYKVYFQDKWICFSPETFVQIKENTIQTFPMKGTIDAGIANAAQVLLNDAKEKAEHSTIVDLLRNDLSLVAKKVQVEDLMYLDKIKTNQGEIYQMSSKITAKIQKNWHSHLGTILQKLLPAGSICGAPKQKTVEIIKNIENYERGFYTGIAGYYDGKSLDSCVLIRFIENTEDGLVYKSGGGITAMSEVQREYEELNQKIYVPIH